jgi:hypothetical protein
VGDAIIMNEIFRENLKIFDCLSKVSYSRIYWLRHWRKSELIAYISWNVTTPHIARDWPEIGLPDGL